MFKIKKISDETTIIKLQNPLPPDSSSNSKILEAVNKIFNDRGLKLQSLSGGAEGDTFEVFDNTGEKQNLVVKFFREIGNKYCKSPDRGEQFNPNISEKIFAELSPSSSTDTINDNEQANIDQLSQNSQDALTPSSNTPLIAIVLPHLGTDLATFLNSGKKISLIEIVMISYNIACQISDNWEEARVIHRDIKPSNIFPVFDGNMITSAILNDYGISIKANSGDPDSPIRGTSGYISPEASTPGFSFDNYQCDIWSLGIMIYQLVTNTPQEKIILSFCPNEEEIKHSLDRWKIKNPKFPEKFTNLIGQMLKKNPADRIQIETVIETLRDLYDILNV